MNTPSLLDSIAEGTRIAAVSNDDDTQPVSSAPGMRMRSSESIVRLLSLGNTIQAALEQYGNISKAHTPKAISDTLELVDGLLQSARKDVATLRQGDK